MTFLSDDSVKQILKKNGQSPADMSDVEVSFDEIESFGDEDSIKEMHTSIKSYNKMLDEKITFINPSLSKVIPFTRENLYVICAYTGCGKCFKKGTRILMFDGSSKKVEDILPGDQVMGPDSKPRNVISLGRGREQMYKVTPTKGDPYEVNKSHILSLKVTTSRKIYKEYKQNDIINISIEDYLAKSNSFKNMTKGYRAGVDFSEQKVSLDPYFLGYWLGDGSKETQRFCTADYEIVDYAQSMIKEINLKSEHMHKLKYVSTDGKAKTYNISTGRFGKTTGRNVILNGLKEYNLINNKHIPKVFKCTSEEIRLKVLAGLVDSDGGGDQGLDFCFKDKRLAKDVVWLCRSLGFAAYAHEVIKKCTNSKTDHSDKYQRISVSGDLSRIPTLIKRKQYSKRKQIKNVLNVGIKVKPTKIDDYYGFTVDGDHLFLLDDFTVVHNTTVSANISYPLWKEKKKILILSNEESKQDILYRIACIEKGHNFNDYKKGVMSKQVQLECIKLFPEIAKYVKILDATYKNNLTSKLEGVKKALEAIKKSDYSAILIDYYQLIQKSIEDSSRSRYDVLNDLRIHLQGYIQSSSIPVVMFAQLHSLSKRAGVDLDQRVKECPAILDSATVVLEVVPNFDEKTTDIMVKKDRFGCTGAKITVAFDKGRFVDMTDEHRTKMKQQQISDILDKAEASLDEQSV